MQEYPEYPGHLIAIARRRIKQAVLRRTTRHRIAPQQFWTLIALDASSGLSQAELAHRVRVDAPTASRVLAALTRRDLVRVEHDPRDRRRSRVLLTPAGERLVRDLASIAQEVRAAVVAGMTEAEVEALRRGLRKVIDNLERFESRVSRRSAS